MTRRAFILGVCLVASLLASPGTARAEEPKEYEIKAAFLYNFTQFVRWPEEAFAAADAPFVVAVVGSDPFGENLERAMAGKAVGRHPIVVARFATPQDMRPCHLLYIARSEDARLSAIFEKLGNHAVLAVGETDAFPWAGGAIRFFMENNRVRFEINLASAEKAKLEISAKLLKLARIFKGR